MDKHGIGAILLLWLLTVSVTAQAESPVWKVSSGENHLYLGGTIHVLAREDYPLPQAFDQAYRDADTVVLETDIAALRSPGYQQKILKRGAYSGDRTLADDLSPDTIELLKDYLGDRGIPATPLFRLKPGLLSVTLVVIELRRLGFTEPGVDEHFRSQALDDAKALDYLETADNQIEFLLSMGQGQEDELIRHTLTEMEQLPQIMGSLKKAWRNGNTRQLKAVGFESWADEFPDVYETLVVERNHNWLPQIERMLETDNTELVLFGALHLVGDNGLLALLEAQGLKVERLD